jgi:hypothetical protein
MDCELLKTTHIMFKARILFYVLLLFGQNLSAQTLHRVTHTFGVQNVNGIRVEVTKIGTTSSYNSCGVGPYWVGGVSTDGHYLFAFSPAIPELQLDFHMINGIYTSGIEEVQIFVNGLHYHVQNQGDSLSCSFIAEITPEGNITGSIPTRQYGWLDTRISGNIDSLRIYNKVISGAPYGSLFSLYISNEAVNINSPFNNVSIPYLKVNTTTNELEIFHEEDFVNAQIISLHGRVLLNSKSKFLSLEYVPSGIYLVKITSKKGENVLKFFRP